MAKKKRTRTTLNTFLIHSATIGFLVNAFSDEQNQFEIKLCEIILKVSSLFKISEILISESQ